MSVISKIVSKKIIEKLSKEECDKIISAKTKRDAVIMSLITVSPLLILTPVIFAISLYFNIFYALPSGINFYDIFVAGMGSLFEDKFFNAIYLLLISMSVYGIFMTKKETTKKINKIKESVELNDILEELKNSDLFKELIRGEKTNKEDLETIFEDIRARNINKEDLDMILVKSDIKGNSDIGDLSFLIKLDENIHSYIEDEGFSIIKQSRNFNQ